MVFLAKIQTCLQWVLGANGVLSFFKILFVTFRERISSCSRGLESVLFVDLAFLLFADDVVVLIQKDGAAQDIEREARSTDGTTQEESRQA